MRGVKPQKFRKASGKIIRNCLQALEKDGLIKKLKKGRVISPKGEAYLTKKAKELFPKAEEFATRERPLPAIKIAKHDATAAEISKHGKGKHDDKKHVGSEKKSKGKKDESESE
jgi:DNA-binding PadR family transcriptional regulator